MTTEAPYISKNLLRKSVLQDSFFEFLQYFWDTVVSEELILNWHMEYICDEMQKLAIKVFNNEPKKRDYIINVPPGTTKSTICSVMFPAWTWANMPSAKSICGSYSYQLSLELSRKSRQAILSEKYQDHFPIQLSDVQNTKGFFVNEYEGGRYATSTGGTVTGFHGHFIIVDDPLSPLEAASEIELKKANTWINNTLSFRKVEKKIVPTILIMQRLHEDDPSGMMLGNKDLKVKHINLPAEISQSNYREVHPRILKRKYKRDPDKKGYRLLDPERMPRSVLEEAEAKLLEYGYAGQFLQRPTPIEGGMFKTERIHIEESCPTSKKDWLWRCRGWDKAATEGGGAFTVGLLMGEDKDHRFWIIDVIRVQVDSGTREKLIKQTAQMDGTNVTIGVEQEPGSGGKESAEGTVINLRGYITEVVRPTGDKAVRALPFSKQVNIGNVYMVKAEWNVTCLNELTLFPNSKYKDQVDACSVAFTVLNFPQSRAGIIGVV